MNNLLPRCTLRPLAPDEGEGYDALHSYLETLKALGHPLPGARRHQHLPDVSAEAVGSH